MKIGKTIKKGKSPQRQVRKATKNPARIPVYIPYPSLVPQKVES